MGYMGFNTGFGSSFGPGFGMGFGAFGVMFTIMFLLFVGVFVVIIVRGISQWNKNNNSPGSQYLQLSFLREPMCLITTELENIIIPILPPATM